MRGNPCPFGGGDSHPATLLLPPGSANEGVPLLLTDQLHYTPVVCLPHRAHLLCVVCGIGSRFSPVHFLSYDTRRISYYALPTEWMLLILSLRCLCIVTSFVFAFNRPLGALSTLWVVSLSDDRLIPPPPFAVSTTFTGSEFKSGGKHRCSVLLQLGLYPMNNLDCDFSAKNFDRNQLPLE